MWFVCVPSFVSYFLTSLTQLLPPRLPWSPITSSSAAAPDCVRYCSPIASASAAALRLCPLRLQLIDCVRFSCSSCPAKLWKVPIPRMCDLRYTPTHTQLKSDSPWHSQQIRRPGRALSRSRQSSSMFKFFGQQPARSSLLLFIA